MPRKLLSAFIGLFFVTGGALAHDEDAAAEKADHWQIIHAGVLIAHPGEPAQQNKSILIKNDRIESVQDGYVAASDKAPDAEIINLRDEIVLPGLIDAHVHLELGGEHDKDRGADRGNDAYRMLNIAENAAKTLDAGYTTVRNPGAYGWALFAYRDGVNKGVFPGPRIFTAGHTINPGTFDGDGTGGCHDVASCQKATRRQIEMGADWIKIYATCSGGKPCGREHAPAVFMQEELEAIVKTARTRQIPVAAHAHGTDGINDALLAGVRTIEHGSYNDAESRRLFKKTGAYYVPTIAVQNRIRKDYETADDAMKPVMEGFMEQHPKRVAAAHKAGVKIAAGSDAGVVPHGENANELFWYVKIGMTEAEALRAATIVNAEMLMKDSDIGSIETGKYADIIAVRENPLENIEALRDVSFVMAGGTVVKRASTP